MTTTQRIQGEWTALIAAKEQQLRPDAVRPIAPSPFSAGSMGRERRPAVDLDALKKTDGRLEAMRRSFEKLDFLLQSLEETAKMPSGPAKAEAFEEAGRQARQILDEKDDQDRPLFRDHQEASGSRRRGLSAYRSTLAPAASLSFVPARLADADQPPESLARLRTEIAAQRGAVIPIGLDKRA